MEHPTRTALRPAHARTGPSLTQIQGGAHYAGIRHLPRVVREGAGDKAAGPFTALVKFPGGAQSPEHSHSSTYSAVVVSGTVSNGDAAALGAGSHWTEIGGEVHTTGCPSEDDCVFYASMDGAFDMKPTAAPAEAESKTPAE